MKKPVIKNLYMLRLEILENLKDGETVGFYLEEEMDEETMFSVSRKGITYTVKLGTEIFAVQQDFDLFDGFTEMMEVEGNQEIPVYFK